MQVLAPVFKAYVSVASFVDQPDPYLVNHCIGLFSDSPRAASLEYSVIDNWSRVHLCCYALV